MTFVLFWGIYQQWMKTCSSTEEAVEEARKYAASKDAKLNEFRLIQHVVIPL